MPIYMDRHDVSEMVTAENVAQLHHEDLKVQHLFDCRGLTYWFDEKRKTAFCLVEAPDVKKIREMHARAHGEVPGKIIEVDAGIVESFLGRIEDPENLNGTGLNIIHDPAFRTIMVIGLTQSTPGSKHASPLKILHEAIPEIIKDYEGSVVRQTKNNYLVSFQSVSKAVHAAREIQVLFKGFREGVKYDQVHMKIGLSAGMPVTEKGSFFEDAIKLAERLCEFIQGDVVVSAEVEELYNSENPVTLKEAGNVVTVLKSDEMFFTRMMDYTETVWDDINLRVEDFTRTIACSKSQLYRKLMALTGKSFNTFIRDYRLTQALQLLNKNSGNISEVAWKSGFGSPSYFSKCFKRKFDQMPSDYFSS